VAAAALPALPERELPPVDVRALIPTAPTAALEVPEDFGTVAVKPPVRVPQPAPAEELKILPPDVAPAVRAATTPPPSPAAVAMRPAGQAGTGVALLGNFGNELDGDEALPPTLKAGVGRPAGAGRGNGAGRGRGVGNGIDRGPSGADRPEPTVLDNPMPPYAEQPGWMRTNPPRAAVVFRIRILETGAIGEIQLVASSGRAEVDAYYREVISKWKFAPAISGGRPVARTTDMIFDPRGL
jgi:TonB family protein